MKFLSFHWSELLWRHRLSRLDAKTLAERRIHSADVHHVPGRTMDRKMILKHSQVTARGLVGSSLHFRELLHLQCVHLTWTGLIAIVLCRREDWPSRDWRSPGAGGPPDWRRPRADWQLSPRLRAVGTLGSDIFYSSSQVRLLRIIILSWSEKEEPLLWSNTKNISWSVGWMEVLLFEKHQATAN